MAGYRGQGNVRGMRGDTGKGRRYLNMKISELIKILEHRMSQYGDVECIMECLNWNDVASLTTVEDVIIKKSVWFGETAAIISWIR
jgi:hypothetical protein